MFLSCASSIRKFLKLRKNADIRRRKVEYCTKDMAKEQTVRSSTFSGRPVTMEADHSRVHVWIAILESRQERCHRGRLRNGETTII